MPRRTTHEQAGRHPYRTFVWIGFGCTVLPAGPKSGDDTLALRRSSECRARFAVSDCAFVLLTHRGTRWITNLREVRIAGKARVIRDAAISKRHAINGKEPLLALVIDVEEAFMHCSKSFIRTRLWHPDHWPEQKSAPTLAEWVIATVDREQTLDEVREDHTADEGARLY